MQRSSTLAKTCPRRERNDQRGGNVGPPWKGQPCRKYRIWQCCIASSMICRPTGKGLAASYVADPVTLLLTLGKRRTWRWAHGINEGMFAELSVSVVRHVGNFSGVRTT